MKIRNGFVSNSSSSSFCIYGAYINSSDFEKFGMPEGADVWDWAEGLDVPGLETHSSDYDYGFYIGRSWSSVKDDETGLQFKESVEKAIKEAFGEELKCGTCSEAWYDG